MVHLLFIRNKNINKASIFNCLKRFHGKAERLYRLTDNYSFCTIIRKLDNWVGAVHGSDFGCRCYK